jgi:hypothetical protein
MESFGSDWEGQTDVERKKGQAAGDGHHVTSSIHVHVGLVRLHAHGYSVVHPRRDARRYVSSLCVLSYDEIKLDPKDRGTALSISERRASPHSLASMCMGA